VVELWRLSHGDTSTADRSLTLFPNTAAAARLESRPLGHAVCGATIEALLAMAEDRTDAGEVVERLDAILSLVPDVDTGDAPCLVGNFIVAKWREAQEDLTGALAAVRRVHNHWFTGVRYLSTYLLEEGRLSELVGDREGAIRAYRHYLSLRGDPEPEQVPAMVEVRGRLQSLVGPSSAARQ
jgi:hypothetical protein